MDILFDQLSQPHALPRHVVLENGDALELQEIVRSVPGRRLVCRGRWEGRVVFAKLFFGDKAAKYADRDRRGAMLLSVAGLLTPRLLEVSKVDGECRVLIYAAIDAQGNAEDRWRELHDLAAERFALVAMLTETVARHHQAGLIQTDLYFKNFLLAPEGVYTLDGDGMRQLTGSKKRRLHNLALLFSKLDVLDDAWVPDLYRRYCAVGGWPLPNDRQIACLRELAYRLRRDMVRNYAQRKVFRNCTDIIAESRFDQFLALVRNWRDAASELAFPGRFFGESELKRLKSGNTCTVSLGELNTRQVVFKRYNIKNFWHGLDRALRQSRAAISWANGHRLVMYGIPTAPPVALLEKRLGPVRRECYFISEYVSGPGFGEFLAGGCGREEKARVAGEVARLFHKLYLLRLEHGDCKATNIRIHDGKALLIDLDAMQQHKWDWWFKRRHTRDLRRLLRNWPVASEPYGLMVSALKNVYNDDGLLARAGVSSD